MIKGWYDSRPRIHGWVSVAWSPQSQERTFIAPQPCVHGWVKHACSHQCALYCVISSKKTQYSASTNLHKCNNRGVEYCTENIHISSGINDCTSSSTTRTISCRSDSINILIYKVVYSATCIGVRGCSIAKHGTIPLHHITMCTWVYYLFGVTEIVHILHSFSIKMSL